MDGIFDGTKGQILTLVIIAIMTIGFLLICFRYGPALSKRQFINNHDMPEDAPFFGQSFAAIAIDEQCGNLIIRTGNLIIRNNRKTITSRIADVESVKVLPEHTDKFFYINYVLQIDFCLRRQLQMPFYSKEKALNWRDQIQQMIKNAPKEKTNWILGSLRRHLYKKKIRNPTPQNDDNVRKIIEISYDYLTKNYEKELAGRDTIILKALSHFTGYAEITSRGKINKYIPALEKGRRIQKISMG